MAMKLRQRCIAAFTLAAIAILFLPLLFKQATMPPVSSGLMSVSLPIPPAPEKPLPMPQTIVMIKNKDLTTPVADSINTAMPFTEGSAGNVQPAKLNHHVTDEINIADSAAILAKSLPGVAWEVRLGNYADIAPIDELMRKLRAHGFKAYTQTVENASAVLTRVAVGPELSRAKAEMLSSELARELNLQGAVARFSPLADIS